MAKKKARPAGQKQKAPAAGGRSRHTHKDSVIAEFTKEYKNNIGMDLTSTDKAVISSMTVEQIQHVGVMLRLSWAKGVRYGSYTENHRKGK